MASLRLLVGVTPGARFSLESGRATIGRSSDCEVPLDVAAVSRRHAEVVSEGSRYFLVDLGSRNGTYVNGRRVTDRTELADGDRVVVCDQEFAFEDETRRSGGRPSLVGGDDRPEAKSSLVELVRDDDGGSGGRGGFQRTIELGAGGEGWSMSARPEAKLAALVEIAKGLGGALSIDEVLPKLLDSLFKIFTQADRAFVVMRPAPEAPLVPVAARTRRGDEEDRIRISRTIVEEAMTAKRAILSADAATDARFEMAQSIAEFQIRSMMCVPMLNADDEAIGVLQVDTLNQRSRFTDDDLEVLAAVASQAAFAVDNARMHDRMVAQQAVERDLELASRMQRALLPAGPPDAPGYGFFDFYDSARQVGGDYFDYISLPGGRFAVVLGDVAGKGVAAAIVMAKISSDVRFGLATQPSLPAAVCYVNKAFAAQGLEDRFVTMVYAVIDPETHEVTLANAGHMAPLLRRASGEVVELFEEISGLPIGIVDDFEYESRTLTLEPGESLLFYTDGFSEAMNADRDLYTTERLVGQVAQPAGSVAEVGQNVLADVRKFVDGYAQSDDMCLCCFGRDA